MPAEQAERPQVESPEHTEEATQPGEEVRLFHGQKMTIDEIDRRILELELEQERQYSGFVPAVREHERRVSEGKPLYSEEELKRQEKRGRKRGKRLQPANLEHPPFPQLESQQEGQQTVGEEGQLGFKDQQKHAAKQDRPQQQKQLQEEGQVRGQPSELQNEKAAQSQPQQQGIVGQAEPQESFSGVTEVPFDKPDLEEIERCAFFWECPLFSGRSGFSCS